MISFQASQFPPPRPPTQTPSPTWDPPTPPMRCSRFDAWIAPAVCSGSSPHETLKTRRCSRLNTWTVPAFFLDRPLVEPYKQGVIPDWTRGSSRVMFRIFPAWSLQNRVVSRIGCMDRPHILFWIFPAWIPKNREVSGIRPKYLLYFVDKMLLFAHVQRVSVS